MNRIAIPAFVLVILVLLMPDASHAQIRSLEGRVTERSHGRTLPGATVWLIARGNPADKRAAGTDTSGTFRFADLQDTVYTLNVSFLGYASVTREVRFAGEPVRFETVEMEDSALQFRETVVEGRMIGTEQKGDTTEYSANAFTTEPDADAEELIEKMPGIDVDDDGSVNAQGEDVQQVLIDGQPYFGSDPAVALKNLPADAIDKIQIFDKYSDQAELTGFDDGLAVKTMNIVTKQERRKSTFGRASGGFGSDSHYQSAAAFNFFNGNRRLSLVGLSNDVNQQNFSQQDILGSAAGGGRTRNSVSSIVGRGGRTSGSGLPVTAGEGNASFLVGQIPGISTSHSFGVNHSDSLWSNVYTNSSYFFNLTDNRNPQNIVRQYAFLPDSSFRYTQSNEMTQKNYNHRVNVQFAWTPDTLNEILFTPRLIAQDNSLVNTLSGTSLTTSGTPLATVESRHRNSATAYSLRGHLVYRHKFTASGRTLSIDAGAGGNRHRSTRGTTATLRYPAGSLGRPDSLDHESHVLTEGASLSSTLVYTEPLAANSLLQFSYNPSWTHGTSDNQSYDFDPVSGTYSIYNPRFSNVHDTKYLTHKSGVGWRFRTGIMNSSVSVAYQIAGLNNDQSFPRIVAIDRKFYNIMPTALLNFDFTPQDNLRIYYRSATTAPSIYQLEDLVNKTNLLLLTAGNPDLKQSFTQTVSAKLSLSDMAKGQSLFLYGRYTATNDYIGSYSFITTHDTIIRRGIHLSRGAEFVEPVNLDGFTSGRLSAMVGVPFDPVRGSLHLNAAVNFGTAPEIIKGTLNKASLTTFSPGLGLSSTSSSTFDYNLSYTAHFNRSRNDVFSQIDRDYYSHTIGLRVHVSFLDGFVLRSDVRNSYASAPADSVDRSLVVWNVRFGHKIFAGGRGEIAFLVHNILNENAQVSRSSEEEYIEDNQVVVLQRYALLTFSYTLR